MDSSDNAFEEVTDPDLQEQLERYNSDFRHPEVTDADEDMEKAVGYLRNHALDAARKIVSIMEYGDKDSVQLSAAKFVYSISVKPDEAEDTMSKLLREMSKRDESGQ